MTTDGKKSLLARSFTPALIVAALMFAGAPFMIARAPYESTMGLVQKIFYFHVPSAMMMFVSAFVCGIASAIFLFKNRTGSDRVAAAAGELVVVFGALVLITGPLWARKSWGVWWQWDARLTSSLILWMIFVAYLILRKYGGPGSEKLAAGLALFGMANVPFVYWSVNVWRTVHPKTTVVPALGPGMREPFWWCVAAFLALYIALLALRVHLEERRARLEALFLELDENF
jgi:heme exporter protein C